MNKFFTIGWNTKNNIGFRFLLDFYILNSRWKNTMWSFSELNNVLDSESEHDLNDLEIRMFIKKYRT